MPVTLTLKAGASEINYPVITTDASGFFTVDVGSLISGTYSWRVKGPDGVVKTLATDPPGFLATSGTVNLTGAAVTQVEMGTQKAGDCDNNNLVSATTDFNNLKNSLGFCIGGGGYDNRADITGDQCVTISDFNIQKVNFGVGGASPLRPIAETKSAAQTDPPTGAQTQGKLGSATNPSSMSTSSTVQGVYNPFGYTEQYTDAESGLVYLRARYYDPYTQQFLTVDPIASITGQAYNYVGGSPLNGWDPSGLDCSYFPNPFDPNSCVSKGVNTPEGPWVVGAGVVAAIIVTGGFVCLAGGCAALGIGGAGAAPLVNRVASSAPVVQKAAPVAQKIGNSIPPVVNKGVQICEAKAAHMFRNEAGHFLEDTIENRQAIIDTANNLKNLVSTAPNGAQTFRQLLSDGRQVWARVFNGEITNGGINEIPR